MTGKETNYSEVRQPSEYDLERNMIAYGANWEGGVPYLCEIQPRPIMASSLETKI